MWWTAIWFSVYISGGTMAINPRNPAFSFIQKFHNIYYANIRCSGYLVMRHLGHLEMRHSPL